MLKVLIADDEARVARHLKASVSWKQLGLEVCATAGNGMEALEIIERQPVDILITDIRMPGMDGLELCQVLREQNRQIQIILLTGFADFEYARRAIQLQVLGYCVKPVEIGDLTELLRSAVRKNYNTQAGNVDALLDVIEGGDEAQIGEAFAELGLSMPVYVAASIGVHNIEKQLGATRSYKLGKHKYLYFGKTAPDQTAAEKIIVYAKGRAGIGILPEPASARHLKNRLDDVLVMAFQYFVNGRPTLCSRVVGGPLCDDVFRQFEGVQEEPMRLKPWLENLAGANCSMIFNVRTAFRLCNRLALCKALQGENEFDESYLCGYEQMAAEYLSLSELLQETADLLAPPSGPARIPLTGTGGCSGSFLAILRYMNENYEKDISLKAISQQFHLNSSYVSQLIKSETGLTFTQYVTELRINKAKELIRGSSLSLSEISEAVGFNDYFYFIKKFKKEVGVTPGKYA